MLANTLAGYNRRLAAGASPYEAAAREQLALFRLAWAHIERVVLEQFTIGVAAQCREPGVDAILGQLRDLFGSSLIEAERGWYLENGLLTPAASKAAPGQVDDLCARLAPEAVALVDAFGIPDECLGSPIGRK